MYILSPDTLFHSSSFILKVIVIYVPTSTLMSFMPEFQFSVICLVVIAFPTPLRLFISEVWNLSLTEGLGVMVRNRCYDNKQTHTSLLNITFGLISAFMGCMAQSTDNVVLDPLLPPDKKPPAFAPILHFSCVLSSSCSPSPNWSALVSLETKC